MLLPASNLIFVSLKFTRRKKSPHYAAQEAPDILMHQKEREEKPAIPSKGK